MAGQGPVCAQHPQGSHHRRQALRGALQHQRARPALPKRPAAKYNLQPPKTWDEMLDDAATISAKEQGVSGLGLTTKTGSVRTFQEFISFFFQVNNGENPYKLDEASQKWAMNTTAEKLATVLKLYQEAFFKATPSAANQNTRDYQATDADYVAGKSAMVPMGPWIYQYRATGEVARKVLEENTGVIALPLPPAGTQATY